MMTKEEYKRSKINQENHILVPLLIAAIYNIIDTEKNGGDIKPAIDHAQELVDSIK